MTVLRQNLSPSAHLLRNSRLFSLPNPLPRPPVSDAYNSTGAQKNSNTATLPFPTHQAIATTPKSLARGDWGFKRALPSRSRVVQTSNPVVKLKQLDTIEHITDYDSASDHVRTREKWEQLGIPVVRANGTMRDQGFGSVRGAFERRSDMTSYEDEDGLDEAGMIFKTIKNSVVPHLKELKDRTAEVPFEPFSLPQPDGARHGVRRWRHDGPWLPGMSANEFTTFMNKQLLARRSEFKIYLNQYVKNEIYAMRQNAWKKAQPQPETDEEADQFLAQQEDAAAMAERAKEWANISDTEVKAGIQSLRREAASNPLQSRLVHRLIVPFLRIPAIKLKDITFSAQARGSETEKYRFDDDVTPLSTHPSAGLGYLRTASHMSNHPILGPQEDPTPVTARVLQPASVGRTRSALIGVGGFVAQDSNTNSRDSKEIDIQTQGGAKLNVHPRFASVTPDGRIHLRVDRAKSAAVQIARGELLDTPPVRRNEDRNVINDLTAGMGQSGVAELDGLEKTPLTDAQNEFVDIVRKISAAAAKEGEEKGERVLRVRKVAGGGNARR